jgi:GR25 family glycosyltransferase involved in LPS biosynthesis
MKLKLKSIKWSNFAIFFAVVFLFICLLFALFYNKVEPFTNVENIDYYVITMRPEDRLKNIDLQYSKIKKNAANVKFEYVDAVVGKDVDVDEMKKTGELVTGRSSVSKNIKNELGCYLSHMKTYDIISKKGRAGYSVIFEDDFHLEDGFVEKLEECIDILKTVNFDMCFLGMLNGSGGEKLRGDVYKIPNKDNMFQTHAYLVNNASISKIVNTLKPVTDIIDVAIFNKGKSGELEIYTIQPQIVSQGGYATSIRTE